ncbi:MAG: hypothetical protein JKX92_01080 [Porticoccaceae bacterium]|nr:hypothetical protein [Porticoccaceae bacterium]
MNILTALHFALLSFIFYMPAQALQITGTEEGEHEGEQTSFTEIYQDGHLVRLENGQLSYRYHDGDCLLVDNEHAIYIENSCKEIAQEIKKQMAQQIAAMQEKDNEVLAAAQKMKQMLQGKEGNIEIKRTGASKINGFNTTSYTAGPSQYSISAELLSRIKKEIDYEGLLKAQQQLLDAYSQANSMFNILENKQNIESQLMAKGYLIRQIDREAMNPAILNILPPETRKAMMAEMGEGSVVLEVTSVEHGKVDITKYKPSGRKASITEYIETMIE